MLDYRSIAEGTHICMPTGTVRGSNQRSVYRLIRTETESDDFPLRKAVDRKLKAEKFRENRILRPQVSKVQLSAIEWSKLRNTDKNEQEEDGRGKQAGWALPKESIIIQDMTSSPSMVRWQTV